MAHDPRHLPSSLPAPVDDGACDHILGLRIPDVHLPSTRGGSIGLVSATERTAVIYVYPRTGVPGVEMPDGWDAIPGARGCTPQSCSYRDDYAAFQAVRVDVYGLSTQSTEAQMEFVEREHIPFPLLSDPGRLLGSALELPTFTAGGDVLYRRVTLIVEAGRVVHVRYPVFPPNRDAEETLTWLRSTRS
ncbi:MAG TPA: peroxiredoxin [Acidimicrobiaceae bacterium]|nr:peroxiredoxin [Acidimicrobiaceae bacterium]